MRNRTAHDRRKRSRRNLWRKQKGKCFYCGYYVPEEEATLDHIQPLGPLSGLLKRYYFNPKENE